MKGLSDAEIRTEWTKAGGSIWGPNIETVGMPEISYFKFRRELERDYKRLSALCTRQGIELMELADLQSQVARLKEALKEAMGWNRLDGDVPSEIQTQCEGALVLNTWWQNEIPNFEHDQAMLAGQAELFSFGMSMTERFRSRNTSD